ncbi:MAG: hypothetical protein IKO10_01910 [Lachnospiraceae bacterium]|nr:hypothetical protein [Lachnospiraceae bacterium]
MELIKVLFANVSSDPAFLNYLYRYGELQQDPESGMQFVLFKGKHSITDGALSIILDSYEGMRAPVKLVFPMSMLLKVEVEQSMARTGGIRL